MRVAQDAGALTSAGLASLSLIEERGAARLPEEELYRVYYGPSFVPLLLSLLIAAFISGWTIRLYWDYKNSAKAFDRWGVVRNDGRKFEWADFVGMDEYINLRGPMRWSYRYELIFNIGKAVVMLPKLRNRDEVLQLVISLPGERRERRSRL